nr:uncharacterized protein LOC110357227 [Columba livia]
MMWILLQDGSPGTRTSCQGSPPRHRCGAVGASDQHRTVGPDAAPGTSRDLSSAPGHSWAHKIHLPGLNNRFVDGRGSCEPFHLIPNPHPCQPFLLIPHPHPCKPFVLIPNPHLHEHFILIPNPHPCQPFVLIPSPHPHEHFILIPNPHPHEHFILIPNPHPREPFVLIPNPHPHELLLAVPHLLLYPNPPMSELQEKGMRQHGFCRAAVPGEDPQRATEVSGGGFLQPDDEKAAQQQAGAKARHSVVAHKEQQQLKETFERQPFFWRSRRPPVCWEEALAHSSKAPSSCCFSPFQGWAIKN